MTTNSPQEIPKFNCVYCEYITNNKKDYSKHLSTLKHINMNEIQQLTTEKSQDVLRCYKCKYCDKTYKYRDGLWRHNKKCKEPTVAEVFANNNTQQITELMLKMIEQNKDLTDKICELAKNSGNNYNNTKAYSYFYTKPHTVRTVHNKKAEETFVCAQLFCPNIFYRIKIVYPVSYNRLRFVVFPSLHT